MNTRTRTHKQTTHNTHVLILTQQSRPSSHPSAALFPLSVDDSDQALSGINPRLLTDQVRQNAFVLYCAGQKSKLFLLCSSPQEKATWMAGLKAVARKNGK